MKSKYSINTLFVAIFLFNDFHERINLIGSFSGTVSSCCVVKLLYFNILRKYDIVFLKDSLLDFIYYTYSY